MTASIKVGDLVKVYEYVWRPDPIPIGAVALVVEKKDPHKVRYRGDLVILYRGEEKCVSSENCSKVPE
jgi:RNA-binding protein YhbY